MLNTIRVAALQRLEICDDHEAVIASISNDLNMLVSEGVDFCLFPECYLQGYPKDQIEVEQKALSLNDVEIANLINLLRNYDCTTIVGFVEREEGQFFNSALVVGKNQYMGCYRKQHPNEVGISPGSESPTFDVNDVSFGVNICNDANFPETSQTLAQLGAQIIFFPLNNLLEKPIADQLRSKTLDNLRNRARDTSCWIISSDVVGENNGRVSYGTTTIFGPNGSLERRVPEMIEGHVIMDIKL